MVFVQLYKKEYLRGSGLAFILLYPDLIMYSSLALRDILILSFMIFGTVLLINRKYLYSLIVFFPLYLIKFQNYFLVLILWGGYLFFMRNRFVFSKKPLFSFVIFFIFFYVILIIMYPYFSDELNFYRRAMFAEDGGEMIDYIPLGGTNDFVYLSIRAAFDFLLKPFPFEASNFLQIVQSVVNILVFLFLFYFTLSKYRINKFKTLFWLSFMLISMAIYGVVVANYGTAARYRFPFIVLYVVMLELDIYVNVFKRAKMANKVGFFK